MRARFINIKYCTAQQIAELKRQYCDNNNSSFSDMHINQIMDVLNYQNTYRSTTIDAASMHLFVFFSFHFVLVEMCVRANGDDGISEIECVEKKMYIDNP